MKNKGILVLVIFLMMVTTIVAKPVKVEVDGSIHMLESKLIQGNTFVKLRDIAEVLGFEISLQGGTIRITKGGVIWSLGSATSMDGENFYHSYSEWRPLNTKTINNTNYVSIRDFTEYFFLSMLIDDDVLHINTKPMKYKRFTDTSKIISNNSIPNLGKAEVVLSDITDYMIEKDKIYYVDLKGTFEESGSGYLMSCDLDGTNKEVLVKQCIYDYATNENSDYIIYTYKPKDPNNPRANEVYIYSQIEVYNKKTKEITYVGQAPVTGTVGTGVGIEPDGTLYFEQGEPDLGYYMRYRITEDWRYVPDISKFNNIKTNVTRNGNQLYFIDGNESNVGIYSSDINGQNKKLLHKVYTDNNKQNPTPQEGAGFVDDIEFTFDDKYIYCQLSRVFKHNGYWNDRKNTIYRLSKNDSAIEWILMDSSPWGTHFEQKNYFRNLALKDNYLYFTVPIVTISYENERYDTEILYRIRVSN